MVHRLKAVSGTRIYRLLTLLYRFANISDKEMRTDVRNDSAHVQPIQIRCEQSERLNLGEATSYDSVAAIDLWNPESIRLPLVHTG